MFAKAFEWLASKSEPRFRFYREARLLYEHHIRELNVSPESVTPEQHKNAARDEHLTAAENAYRQAIELSRQASAPGDVATGLYQLAMLLYLRGSFTEARETLTEAGDLLHDLPFLDRSRQTTISGCHYYSGLLYLQQGNNQAAINEFRESLKIDEANGDLAGVTLNRKALAKCGEVESVEVNLEDPTENTTDQLDAEPPAGSSAGFEFYPTDPIKREEKPLTYDRRFRHALSSINEDVIWLISYSTGANDALMEELEKLSDKLSRKLTVSRVAFGLDEANQGGPDPLAADATLAAAILVIEREGLENEAFQYWANWCIKNVIKYDDFRLFVWLYDVSREELDVRADSWQQSEINQLLADLRDSVELPDQSSSPLETIDQLRYQLSSHLNNLDHILADSRWRRLHLRFSITLGQMAKALEIICGIALAGVIVGSLVLGEQAVLSHLSRIPPRVIALISGSVLFPLTIIPFFLLLRGHTHANFLLRQNPGLVRWLVLGAVLGPATIGLPEKLGAMNSSIALGVVIGILLEIARRNGVQAKRSHISLFETRQRAASPSSARLVQHSRPNPWNYPLFPPPVPKVFISYTRSQWSEHYARALHAELKRVGCTSFLDYEGIGHGSYWRRILDQSLAEANVFIAILEERSLGRGWVAAELTAALMGKRIAELPDVIVLMKPGLADQKVDKCFPVLHALLDRAGKMAGEGQPRFIAIREDTISRIASELSPHRYKTISIFPSQLAFLFMLPTIPAAAIGTFGTFFGLLAIIFAVLQQWEKFNSGALLLNHGVLTSVYLLCSYWLGFTARLTVASSVDLKRKESGAVTNINKWSTIGFLLLLLVWSTQVSIVVLSWAFAVCVIGWIIASGFISRVKIAAPDFSS